MVETFFTRSCTLNRLRQGPLAGHIDMLAEWLEAHGFSRVHSRIQIRLVGHFNRWLDQKGLSAKQIDETLIEHYWRFFQRRKRVRWFDVGALVRLLDLLRQEGVTPQRRIEAVPTPREALLESYRCYRARSAVLPREQSALQFPSLTFLAHRFPRHHFDFAVLNAKDITTFIRKQAAEPGSVQAKHMVTALRGFFRYLRHRGQFETDLAGCVPRVPYYSLSTVPRPADWQR